MSSKTTLILLCATALLTAPLGAKMKVQTQHQAGNDCKQYKTYQWLPVRTVNKSGIHENDPLSAPLIKAAVDRELQAKGLKQVESGGDLQIATAAMKESSPHTDAIIIGWFPSDYGSMYWSTAEPVMALTSYSTQGTFVVNLIDAKTKKSAWVAMAKDTVDSQKQAKAKVDKALQMFENFRRKALGKRPEPVGGHRVVPQELAQSHVAFGCEVRLHRGEDRAYGATRSLTGQFEP